MSPTSGRGANGAGHRRTVGYRRTVGHRRTAGILAGAVMLSGLGLAGCGVVSAVKKIANNVASNRATIDDFTSKLQSGEATAFEAKYMTTGSAPATIVYAVQPPKGLAFKDTAQGILGYVKVAGDSTSFQIRSYTTSPSPALFRLPPGAKVTNVKNGKG